MESIFVIGVAGGTGSGKTTVVEQIINQLPTEDICVISQDSYYKTTDDIPSKERTLINFDHPRAIDFELLTSHIQQLKNGNAIEQPVYSFASHNRTKETVKTLPKKVIIIEGILIFNNEELRNLCNLKIFVHTDTDERLIRRIKRDITERGRDINEVLTRYQTTLKPMHQMFIEPTKVFADIIIPNDRYNNVAVDVVRTVIRKHL